MKLVTKLARQQGFQEADLVDYVLSHEVGCSIKDGEVFLEIDDIDRIIREFREFNEESCHLTNTRGAAEDCDIVVLNYSLAISFEVSN